MLGRRCFSQLCSYILLLIILLGAVPSRAWAQTNAPSQAGESVSERSTPINAVPEKREEEADTNEQYRHSKAVVKLGSLVGLSAEQAATIFEVLNFVVLAHRYRRGQCAVERRGRAPFEAG